MRSKNLWKFKFFWDDAKNDTNILKNIFFWIFIVFQFFMKIYQNMGQKLGSNNVLNLWKT